MNKELEEKIYKEFDFYRGWFTGYENHIPLQVGDGWFDLIYEMSNKIKATNPTENFRILELKEKLGTIRVNAGCSTNEIEDIIDFTVSQSKKTCEECGKPGSMRCINSWYMVRCDECCEEVLNRLKNGF
jgi:hypothetical protein